MRRRRRSRAPSTTRADDDGHHDAEAVGQPSHADAREAEADHRQRVRQRGGAARDAELRLHGRQRHDDRPHADAADGRQQQATRRGAATPAANRPRRVRSRRCGRLRFSGRARPFPDANIHVQKPRAIVPCEAMLLLELRLRAIAHPISGPHERPLRLSATIPRCTATRSSSSATTTCGASARDGGIARRLTAGLARAVARRASRPTASRSRSSAATSSIPRST